MPRLRLSTVGQSEPWFSGTFVGPEAGIRHPFVGPEAGMKHPFVDPEAGIRHPFVGPEAGMKRPVLEPDLESSPSGTSIYPLRRLSRTIPLSSWTTPLLGPVAAYRRPGPA